MLQKKKQVIGKLGIFKIQLGIIEKKKGGHLHPSAFNPYGYGLCV